MALIDKGALIVSCSPDRCDNNATLFNIERSVTTMPTGSYDAIANWYDEFVMSHPFYSELVLPNLLDLVGDVEGQHVCDIACGQGLASRALRHRGAEVVGIDISEAILKLARRYESEEPLGINYLLDDAQTLASQREASFDGITCCMGLINIPDLAACVRSVHRVLKPGGWFVFCITHPCFEAPFSEWLDEDERKGRLIQSYFDEGYWQKSDPEMLRGKVGDWHRPVSTYINTLIDSGLNLERVVEPHITGQIAELHPERASIPNLMMVRACKRA
jgi:ubiquinone/menaquinone biosynthesis C-methylase UbiE